MAKFEKPNLIDGFSSVQAVKHSAERHGGGKVPARPAPPPTRPPHTDTPSHPAATRIGSTAVPRKFNLTCYGCGYRFVLQGRLERPLCPKCKRQLDAQDHTLETRHHQDIQTVGTIDIRAEAQLGPVTLFAREIRIAGDAQQAHLKVTEQLILAGRGSFTPSKIEAKSIKIEAGGEFNLSDPWRVHNLLVCGTLHATIESTGMITIKSGGQLRGEIQSAHLLVEDGASLSARLNIRPGASTQTQAERQTAGTQATVQPNSNRRRNG